VRAEFVDAPVPRPLARLEGDLEQLLADPGLAGHEQAWVQAVLTDDARPVQAMERIRRRFPHTLSLSFAPSASSVAAVPRARVEGRGDHEVTLDFVRDLRGSDATEAEATLLRTAVDACCHDADLDHAGTEPGVRAAGGGPG
jgi:exonuclease SbcD